MDLNTFLQSFPFVQRLDASHNDLILKFFCAPSRSQKRLSLLYDRSPNFFQLLTYSTPHSFVLGIKNDQQELEVLSSFSLYQGKDGVDSLYLGDLKVKTKNEETKRIWREFGQKFIENLPQIDEFKKVRFIHMVMMDDNTKAYERLAKHNVLGFKFKKVSSYVMVNVLGKIPFKRVPHGHFKSFLKDASAEEYTKLVTLSHSHKNLVNDKDFIQYRVEKLENCVKLVSIRNENDELLFMGSLEDVREAKKIIVCKMSWALKLSTLVLPLFKGKSYRTHNPMDILYFSNLYFTSDSSSDEDKASLINLALEKIYEVMPGKYHSIAFSFFQKEMGILKNINNLFLTQTEPMAFYQICTHWSPDWSAEQLPNFNMSYV